MIGPGAQGNGTTSVVMSNRILLMVKILGNKGFLHMVDYQGVIDGQNRGISWEFENNCKFIIKNPRMSPIKDPIEVEK